MKKLLVTLMASLVMLLGMETKVEATPTSYKAFQKAKNLQGVNYKLGGHWAAHNWWKHGGLDCSGLTMLAYERTTNGRIHLYDSLGPLWRQTKWASGWHRGDIVFYKERGSNYFTHVGMYAGKNSNGRHMIIHASAYWGKVTVKPMRWRGDGFVGVRRVKGA